MAILLKCICIEEETPSLVATGAAAGNLASCLSPRPKPVLRSGAPGLTKGSVPLRAAVLPQP